MGQRTTESCRRHNGYFRSAHHRLMYQSPTIMEEVTQHHRNLAVASFDYKKPYNIVQHDWMIRVYKKWIGIPRSVIKLIKGLMMKWKTRLEIWSDREKMASWWIQILCGFLQGDSYSSVGFCISEIPVCILPQHCCGYRIGELGNHIVKRKQPVCRRSKSVLRKPQCVKKCQREIVLDSHKTRACYGVSKCVKTIFEHGKIVRGESLQVLEQRMKTMDSDENKIYKFLGIEQTDGIRTKQCLKEWRGIEEGENDSKHQTQ